MKKWICKNVSMNEITFPQDLGRLMASLPEVKAHRLRLYCGVGEARLEHPGAAPSRDRFFDALYCREDGSVVLAVESPETSEDALFREEHGPGFRILQISRHLLHSGGLEKLGNILEQAVEAPPALRAPVLQGRLLPADCLEKLDREQMLEPDEDGVPVLSAYGRFFGLIQGYGADCYDTSRSAGDRARIFCPHRLERKLRRALTGPFPAEAVWEKLPLRTRLERLERGLPSNGAYSLALTRRFYDMPLERYLSAYPGVLEDLRAGLGDSPAETYGQAAVSIDRLLQQKATHDQGKELMYLLAIPLAENGR